MHPGGNFNQIIYATNLSPYFDAMSQCCNTVLMVRPAHFGFNSETAESNAFQQKQSVTKDAVKKAAIREFDAMVELLRKNEIEVIVVQDDPEPVKTCAVFPNNWFCVMPDASLTLFPMHAASRRVERTPAIINILRTKYNIVKFTDWSKYENVNWFLESTGSMVMDHLNKLVYACISPRTHRQMVEKFAKAHGYKAICFEARDPLGNAIYHTNVIMHIGDGYAVLCGECIHNSDEKEKVYHTLAHTRHIIIEISMHQVYAFAGNMLQVENKRRERVTILSRVAYDSLSNVQIKALTAHTWLLPIPLNVIEKVGGGSVRCMLAEIFAEPVQTDVPDNIAS